MIISRRLAGWLAFVFVLAALNYAGRYGAGGGEMPDDALFLWSTAIGGMVQFAINVGILLLIARGLDRRWAFALRQPPSWGRALGIAALVFLAVYALAGALSPFLDPGGEQGLLPNGWKSGRAAPFVANFVIVALVAPVTEELTFRGLGYTLLEPFGRWQAIGLTALLFGLAHGLIEGLPVLVLFGAGLALLRARTGSIYPGIVLHALFNSSALTFAVLM